MEELKYDYQEFWSERGKNPADKWSLSKQNNVRETLNNLKFDSVLELGCGNGEFSNLILEYTKNVEGIDISTERLLLSPYSVVLAGNFLEWEFKNQYDVVCCSHFLLHIKPEDVIMAIGKMLNLATKYVIFIEPLKDRIPQPWRYYNFEHDYIKILEILGYSGSLTIEEVEPNVGLYKVTL